VFIKKKVIIAVGSSPLGLFSQYTSALICRWSP